MISLIDKYLIKTNIWVALCFTALLSFFQIILYEINWYVLGIVFFGTLAIYNFSRIGSLTHFVHLKSKYQQQTFLTLLGLTGTLLFVVLRGFELKTFLYLGVLGFVSFCYSLPFSGLGLRTIPFLKLFLIAFVWAGSSIGLLLVVHHSFIQHQLLFLSVFFFVVGITVPFDIRDKHTDEKELKTIPQVIGVMPSKIFSVGSLILSMVLFYLEFNSPQAAVFVWIVTCLTAVFLVLNATYKRSELYYSFWMESCSVVPLLLFLILYRV